MKKLNAWLSDWGWWLYELMNARPWRLWLFFIVNLVLLLVLISLLDLPFERRKDWRVAVPLLAAGELLFSIIVFIIISKQSKVDKRTPRKRGSRTRHK